MANPYPTTLRRMLIALNGNDGPDYYQAGAATIYPGHIVMYDDEDEVKICTSTGVPIGIAGCDADHDLMTAYASGDRVPVWLLGSGVDIYVKCTGDAASFAFERGTIVVTGNDTSLVGECMPKDSFIVATTTFNATAVTERNISAIFWIGRCLEAGSVTTNVTAYIPVRLGL